MFLFSRSEFEKIVLSKDMLSQYVQEQLPNYYIEAVAGDGLCILRSFKVALEKTKERTVNIDSILETLRSEILGQYEFYKEFSSNTINILKELDNFLKEPLKYFNTDTGDIFLMALGNAYEVKTVILQSNCHKCWTTDLSDQSKNYMSTLYFARSESLHLEPIIPKSSTDSSDSEVYITHEIQGTSSNTTYSLTKVKVEKNNKSCSDDDSDIELLCFIPGQQITQPTEPKTEPNLSYGRLQFYVVIYCK